MLYHHQNVLAQLAPVIQHVKCGKLKTARLPTEDSHRAYCFSATHISALSNANTSLQELCVSDNYVQNLDDIMSDASIHQSPFSVSSADS